MKFSDLQIREEIVTALQREGIIEPTPIQEKAIPEIIKGKDVVAMSKTGSGKTATFGIPLLETLDTNAGLQYLVIAPTRELAVQICNEMRKFGKNLKFNTAMVFGGVAINPQMEAISKAHIVVGTPGRLMDHLQRGTLDLSKLKTLVLDEADKMVEMGFIEDIEYIISKSSQNRQIILLGATISSEIDYLKNKHMSDSVEIQGESHVADDFLKQSYYNVKHNEKFSLLVHLLKKETIEKAIIFCSARSTVELLTKNLRKQGVKAEMIHGKLSQNRRLKIMDDFNNKDKVDILVASAVAARGLDIKFVTHVINYDLSQDPQEYVHRVGRTARAGESGKAITLLSEKDFGTFGEILSRYKHLNVEEMPDETFEKVSFDTSLRTDSPRNGPRGSNKYSRSYSGSGNDRRSSHGSGYRSGSGVQREETSGWKGSNPNRNRSSSSHQKKRY